MSRVPNRDAPPSSKGFFRVVALSATPGTDLQAVRTMLQNLLISRIELRNEESPDIVKYTHQRKIEKVVVGLSEELKSIKEKYLAVLEHFVKRLSQSGVLGKLETQIQKLPKSNPLTFGLLVVKIVPQLVD